jgi:predicted nucleic acid-binding protein
VARQKVILADASPLIGLARIGGLTWMRKLYRSVVVTRAVRAEVLVPGRAGQPELAAAFRARWLRQLRSEPAEPEFPRLDAGEASTLRAALALGDRALVILDDFAARREARRLGVKFVGTAGVIVEAKRTGLIDRAAPAFERLTNEGFHLSEELIHAILAELRER